jgi:hypothetical protein
MAAADDVAAIIDQLHLEEPDRFNRELAELTRHARL